MTALTLFDATVADVLAPTPGAVHRDGRPTEVAAARAHKMRAGTQKAAVLAALADAGPDGLTGHEACDLTTCAYPHSATTRLEELTRLGLAEPTDQTRRTPSGLRASVWAVTDAGRRVATELGR